MRHIYQPAPEILEKIRTSDYARIAKDALSAWSWCFDNHDEDFGFSINLLHKAVFCKRTRAQVDEILKLLQNLKVVSAPVLVATTTARNKREMRYLEPQWTVTDLPKELTPGDIFTTLEKSLFSRIMEYLIPKSDTFEFKDVTAVRALLDFNSSFQGFHRKHHIGEIIDSNLDFVQFLLRDNSPVAPLECPGMVICPSCRIKFDTTQSERPENPPLVCQANLDLYIDGMYIKYKIGELITDFRHAQHALNIKAQVDYAKVHEYIYCPNNACQSRYFKRVW